MATKRWMPDHPDDDNCGDQNQPDPPDSSDGSDRPSRFDLSEESGRSDKSTPADQPHEPIPPPSPPSYPSLSDLGKPPEDDPLKWNPRLREVLDLIRGHASADLQHALVSMGFVREEDVLQALAMETRMERVDWDRVTITPELLAQVPEHVAWRFHVFPVRFDPSELQVALADPLNPAILQELEQELGKPVRGMIASEGEILRMLGMHYG